MTELFVVLTALCLGSFGNVFLARYPKGRSVVSPPSSCPHCGKLVRFRHNIPVLGWLILRGRCYDCGKPISARYPAMEAAFGLVAWGMMLRFGATPLGLCYLGFFLALLLIAWVDWETMHIFDACSAPLAVAGVMVSWFFPGLFPSRFDSAVAGVEMLAGMLVLAGLGKAWYRRDVVGVGDLKLMAAGAAFLGTAQAWKALALGVFAALPLMALYLKSRGLKMKDPAPFGPGLALGLALAAWNLATRGGLDGIYESLGLFMLKAN